MRNKNSRSYANLTSRRENADVSERMSATDTRRAEFAAYRKNAESESNESASGYSVNVEKARKGGNKNAGSGYTAGVENSRQGGNNAAASAGRKLAGKAVWLMILAICFVTVFGVALTFDTGGLFGTSLPGTNGSIADAGDAEISANVSIISPDNILQDTDFGFPGTNPDVLQWKTTASFSEPYYTNESKVVDGETIYPTVATYKPTGTDSNLVFTPGTGQFTLAASEYVYNATSFYALFNVNVGGFITNFLKNDNVTIDAKLSADMNFNDGGGIGSSSYGLRAMSRTSAIIADDKIDYNTIGSDNIHHPINSEDPLVGDDGSWGTTSTARLTKEEQNLALAFSFRRSGSWGGGAPSLAVSNIKVEFTITIDQGKNETSYDIYDDNENTFYNDYAKPIINPYTKDNSVSGKALTTPYRSSVNDASWPVYNKSVESVLNRNLDSAERGSSRINLKSFTNAKIASIGPSGNVRDYYKTFSFDCIDQYNYSTGSGGNTPDTEGDAYNVRYSSGIKQIIIGDETYTENGVERPGAVFLMYNELKKDGNVVSKVVYSDSIPVAYASVKRINRARYEVQIYFYTNASFSVKSSDYGNRTTVSNVNVTGIDTTTPESPDFALADGVFDLNGSLINQWYIYHLLNVEPNIAFEENTEPLDGYTPYLWYYSVARTDTPWEFAYSAPELGALDPNGDYKASYYNLLKNATPFSYNSSPRLNYDFATGVMSNGTAPIGVPQDARITGAGYYRFTVYTMDFAGNVGVPIIGYMKVDYTIPDNTVSASFGKSNNKVDINPDYTAALNPNGTWATDALKVEILLNNGENYSGNTVTFNVIDGENSVEYRVLLQNGNIVVIYIDGIPNNITSPTTSRNGILFNYSKTADKASLTLEFCNDSSLSFLNNNKFPEYDFRTSFSVTTGFDADTDYQLRATDPRWKFNTYGSVTNAVCIRVDRNKPEDVKISDDDSYFEAVGNTSNSNNLVEPDWQNYPSDGRNWYTDGWNIYGNVAFSDTLLGTYGKDIKLFIGMKVNGKALIGGTSIIGHANDLGTYAEDELRQCFDSLNVISGTQLASSATVGAILNKFDLLNNLDAGLRLIYTWAVDQAGNVSALSIYQILVDANTYTVNVSSDSTHFQNSGVDFRQSNEAGQSGISLRYKRGNTMNLLFNMQNYIPYRVRAIDQNGTLIGNVLENDTLKNTFKPGNVIGGDFMDINGMDISVKIDMDYLTRFRGSTLMLQYRKLVNFQITNNIVQYSGGKTAVPLTVDDANVYNPNAATPIDEFQYTFYNYLTETTETEYIDPSNENVPVVPGDYKVTIKLDTPYYIAETKTKAKYTIINREATVIAQHTESDYGSVPKLKYKIDGLSKLDQAKYDADITGSTNTLGIIGSLKINTVTPEANWQTLDVGVYYVIEGTPFSLQYYDLSFEGSTHTITPHTIEINVSPGQKKLFGEPDPEIVFLVDPASFRNSDSAATVFLNARVDEALGTGGKLALKGNNLILREAGEFAGAYAYNTSDTRIIINSNYTVKVNVEMNDKFVIEKRVLKITVPAGQFAAVLAAEDITEQFTDNVHIGYILNDFKESQFTKFLTGSLKIDTSNVTERSENGYTIRTYNVILGDPAKGGLTGDDNVSVEFLTSGYTFDIRIDASVVIIRQKPDMKLEAKTYGDAWNSAADGQFSKDMFDVIGLGVYDETWNYRIEWNASVKGHSGGLINRGLYTVETSDHRIFKINDDKTETEITGKTVLVEAFSIEFMPFEVNIKPTVVTDTRVYGQPDSVYGFDYEITNTAAFAGKDFTPETVRGALISGEFTRGKYKIVANKPVFVENGMLYDDVNNGMNPTPYMIAVGEFFNGGINFSIKIKDGDKTESDVLSSIILKVTPKPIEVSGDSGTTKGDFVGLSKNYDGTTEFNAPEGWTPLNLKTFKDKNGDHALVRVSDDVQFGYIAEYSSAEVGEQTLLLKSPRLFGAQAKNYKLVTKGVDVSRNMIFQVNFDIDGQRISINACINFSITKNDITVSKQYDGTAALDKKHIKIAGALSGLSMEILSDYSFPQSDRGENLTIRQLELFFSVPGISEENWTWDSTIPHDDVTVTIIKSAIGEGGQRSGILVRIENVTSSITQRVLSPSSFDYLQPINRPYDATDSVDFDMTFLKSQIVAGDTEATIGLKFKAHVQDKNAGYVDNFGNITKTRVVFDGYEEDLLNPNYSLNIDDFKNYYETGNNWLTVAISRAKLSPDLIFNMAKQYDGVSMLTKATDNTVSDGDVYGTGGITAQTITPELAAELKHLSYNWADVQILYSIDGKENPFVAFDANNNVLAHDILIKGLIITFTETVGGSTASRDIFRNYEFPGDLSLILPAGQNTIVMDENGFEMKSAAPLGQKIITAIVNNITVDDKIYDGSKEAIVEIKLDGIAAVDKDKVHLVIEGEFKNPDASINKDVHVVSRGFANTDTNDKLDYALNYKLGNVINTVLKASIFKAPLTLSLGVGEKTYDGKTSVNVNNIPQSGRKLEGFTANGDDVRYDVSVIQANYSDENVNRAANADGSADPEGEVLAKDAMAYDVSLLNVYNYDTINYYLRFESTEADLDVKYGFGKEGSHIVGVGADAVTWYYYTPGESDDYILASVYDAANDPEAQYGVKLGNYYINKDNNLYYLLYQKSGVSYSGNGEVKRLTHPVTYMPATGKIVPRAIKITATVPEGYQGNAYVKDYDSSTEFYGSFGADFVLGSDLIGIVAGDDVRISAGSGAYSAAFATSMAGSTHVEISITALEGADLGNYSYKNSKARIPARINKIDMNAKLLDDEITYGETKSVYDKIEYSLTLNNHTAKLVCVNGEMYILLEDFSIIYPKGKPAARYNISNGMVSVAADGEYLKLFGDFKLPSGKTSVNVLTGVGKYNYTLKGGESSNYDFVYDYTVPAADGVEAHSVLTVGKATLYVYARGEYIMTYGEGFPQISLGYASSASGPIENGFKNNENERGIFGADLINAYYRLYKAGAWTGGAVGDQFALPVGNDFIGIFIDVAAYETALANYEIALRSDVAKLIVNMPEIPEIYVEGQNETNPQKTDYTGENMSSFVLDGNLASDKITYKVFKKNASGVWESATEAINAGEYKLEITVERKIPNDKGGNSYAPTKATAYLTIEPASLRMSANKETFVIDFKDHTFDKNSIKFNPDLKKSVLPKLDRISVKYEWIAPNSPSSVSVEKMRHAGRYSISLSLDSDTTGNFLINGSANTAKVTYIIEPLKIDVKVGEKTLLFDGADNTKLEIVSATLSKDYDSMSAAEKQNLSKNMPKLAVRYKDVDYIDAIPGPGKYMYVVEPVDASLTVTDYRLLGESSGYISVGHNTVIAGASNDNYNASVSMTDGNIIVAEQLVYKQIYESNLSSASDDAYWRRVAAYMPQIGSKEVPASLAAIVSISMTYNGQTINLAEDKTATLRVKLPNGVTSLKNMAVYRVSRDGGLIKVDYTLDNGYVVYVTDYIAPLVFVKLGASLPVWAIALIAVGSVLAAAAVTTGVILGVKKHKRV